MIPTHDRVPVELDGDTARKFRTVGALHLGLAAAVNLASGAALIHLGSTDQLIRPVFIQLDAHTTSYAVLREATTVVTLVTTGAILAGAILAVLSAVAALIVLRAFRARGGRSWAPVSLASAINPLAAPLALIAAVLLWLGCPVDRL